MTLPQENIPAGLAAADAQRTADKAVVAEEPKADVEVEAREILAATDLSALERIAAGLKALDDGAEQVSRGEVPRFGADVDALAERIVEGENPKAVELLSTTQRMALGLALGDKAALARKVLKKNSTKPTSDVPTEGV